MNGKDEQDSAKRQAQVAQQLCRAPVSPLTHQLAGKKRRHGLTVTKQLRSVVFVQDSTRLTLALQHSSGSISMAHNMRTFTYSDASQPEGIISYP